MQFDALTCLYSLVQHCWDKLGLREGPLWQQWLSCLCYDHPSPADAFEADAQIAQSLSGAWHRSLAAT